jgi:hypothetical protein
MFSLLSDAALEETLCAAIITTNKRAAEDAIRKNGHRATFECYSLNPTIVAVAKTYSEGEAC